MYHMIAQGVDGRMINVYNYYNFILILIIKLVNQLTCKNWIG